MTKAELEEDVLSLRNSYKQLSDIRNTLFSERNALQEKLVAMQTEQPYALRSATLPFAKLQELTADYNSLETGIRTLKTEKAELYGQNDLLRKELLSTKAELTALMELRDKEHREHDQKIARVVLELRANLSLELTRNAAFYDVVGSQVKEIEALQATCAAQVRASAEFSRESINHSRRAEYLQTCLDQQASVLEQQGIGLLDIQQTDYLVLQNKLIATQLELNKLTRNKTMNKETMIETVKSDATDAGYRVAGKQLVKLVRDPLAATVARHLGPEDESLRMRVSEFLTTDVGTAMLAGMLSAGLSALPNQNETVQKLARELRVQGMSDMGNMLADVLTGPLMQVVSTYLKDMPEDSGVRVAELPENTNVSSLPGMKGRVTV